jgi:two-component sensor histidine kinase
MVHASRCVASARDVDALFSDAPLSSALLGASAILVQIFWKDPCSVDEIARAVLRREPRAIVVGAASAGHVVSGALAAEGIVLSVSCFSLSRLEPFFLEVEPGKELESGARLAAALASCKDIKGALLFAPPMSIDAAALARALGEALPSLPVFGGGAVQEGGHLAGILFGDRASARGVAAVALCGNELFIEATTLFDWRPLGPPLFLTEVERGCIRRIDGAPAFEQYREKLDIEDGEDLFLLEFPLLIERDGRLLACNPLSVEADGGVRIVADAYAGETARFGYLDVSALATSVGRSERSLRKFSPECIFLYSCVCRLFTLQEEVEMETLPFQGLAPTAGFFTSGEFCRQGGSLQLLNSSEVVVALREGLPLAALCEDESSSERPVNPSRERHVRITSRLFHFIGSLTDSLDAEVAEHRRAEEREKAIAAEKEELLRELLHRVKNSMAVISSIASIEARKTPSPEARDALEKLEARIAAMASLYDILYVTGSVEEIGLAEYLGRVVEYAAAGLGADARDIAVVSEIESVRLDVKRAVSLGLIVNELVTDCLKHAFPGGKKGSVEVRLERVGRELSLRVSDDGIGLPADFDAVKSPGFGLALVRSLATGLDASFSARSGGGARFELRMPL